MEDIYRGKTFAYWEELERQSADLSVQKLIGELATLRAKTSFYEARISELSQFMELKLEVKK